MRDDFCDWCAKYLAFGTFERDDDSTLSMNIISKTQCSDLIYIPVFFFFLDGYIPVLNSPSGAKSSKPCNFDHGNHRSRLYPYINIYIYAQSVSDTSINISQISISTNRFIEQ